MLGVNKVPYAAERKNHFKHSLGLNCFPGSFAEKVKFYKAEQPLKFCFGYIFIAAVNEEKGVERCLCKPDNRRKIKVS